MTDRELMQQALDALGRVTKEMLACKDALAERGGRPVNNKQHQSLWDSAHDAYVDVALPAANILHAALAQPEQEPVAWVAYENGEKHGIDFDEDEIAELPVGTMLYPIPPNFLDPAKVARLIDEAFERGKKEIDMEQVKDIAQKLADCAVLNSAPPQRKWQGLTDKEVEKIYLGSFDEGQFARAIEAKLKEKNAPASPS